MKRQIAKKLSLKQQKKKKHFILRMKMWICEAGKNTHVVKQDRKTCDKVTRLYAYLSGLELVLYTIEKQSNVVVKITVPEAKMPGFKFQLHHLQTAPAWEADFCNSSWVPVLVFFLSLL